MKRSFFITGIVLLVTIGLGPASALAQTRPKTAITQRTATKASPEQDAQAMYTARASAEKVAAMLRDKHRQSDEQATGILQKVGYRADDVTAMLIARRLPPEKAMLYTRNAGYASTEVATAMSRQGIDTDQLIAAFLELNMRDGGNAPASEIAQFVDAVLTDAKASMNEIRALKKKVVGWMLEAGYNRIEVTRSLTETGTEVNLVAEGLHAAGVTAEAAAEAARDAGYSPEQIAAMLAQVYDLREAAIAEILKNLGYGVMQVVGALNTLGLNLSAQDLVDVLTQAGFIRDKYVEVLESTPFIGLVGGYAVAEILKSLDYPMAQVAEALKAAGTPSVDTAAALRDAFDASASEVAEALVETGYGALEVAEALNEQFNYTLAQTMKEMLQPYNLDEVVEAVADVYNASAEQIAEVLEGEGYDASEITAVLQEVFQASAAEIAQALSQAGFDIPQITQAIIDLFNMTAAEVAGLFAQLGLGG